MIIHKFIFIIPGNPGIADYYNNLKNLLESGLGRYTSIHILPYYGFRKDKPDRLYNLIEETEDKIDQIEAILNLHTKNTSIKKSKSKSEKKEKFQIILIGHSIGGWIAKEIAIRNPQLPIKKIFLIFPFLKLDPNSKIQRIFKYLLKYDLYSFIALTLYKVIRILPYSFTNKLLKGLWNSMNQDSQKITQEYFLRCSHIPRSVIHLARSEFKVLDQDLDKNFFNTNPRKIHLIYNDQDIWAPISHLKEIQNLNPNISSSLLKGDLHDFCTHNSGNKIVSEILIEQILKSFRTQ
ncbi:hypothetical protein [Leptospira sp. GIMC2001]|uniref:hypothetical protein n=1 Tax=Leptospira sp. GIMC2001 TaxID=1513297 RepID=UPI00234B0737|nr:hypothetical protein [Leptospira sp. GIMC2001]WCL49618.1 hypothetical protein O4O04_02030 [Leptospira sp. GIMC2001]